MLLVPHRSFAIAGLMFSLAISHFSTSSAAVARGPIDVKLRAFKLASTYRDKMDDVKDEALIALRQALAELRAGRLDAAESLTAKLLAASPNDPAAHQLTATLALRRARYEEADRWARSCLALRPRHAPAMVIAGRAARATGDFVKAVEWFRAASELSPRQAEAHFQLCLAQLEGKDPEAKSTLDRLLRQFPGDAEGWSAIGFALRNAGQLEAAEAAFARAAAASNDPAHHVDLGRTMLARGRAAEAIAPLRRALTSAPDRLDALMPLAQALRQTGEPREAFELLRRLCSARPDKAPAFYALGLACEDLRDWTGAIAAYRRCIELQPDMPEAHVNLGLALQQIGEFDPALQCYRRAMGLRPETFGRIVQALPSTNKGQLWLDIRKLRRALGGQ
jgi:tetratricopeptide (TPR) repeat protein